MMSRESTEWAKAVGMMCKAASHEVFTDSEMCQMLGWAMGNLTTAQIEQMVADCTRFQDLVDVEVASQ
jgi:galactitol-specific phosphotransferase system IIC component